MSDTKTDWTPGPWQWGINPLWSPEMGPSRELVVRPAGEFPHGEWIADCGLAEPDREANCRLIAAAPDLYAALEAAVECGLVPVSSVSEGGANKYSEQVRVADQIRAALAKARGETP